MSARRRRRLAAAPASETIPQIRVSAVDGDDETPIGRQRDGDKDACAADNAELAQRPNTLMERFNCSLQYSLITHKRFNQKPSAFISALECYKCNFLKYTWQVRASPPPGKCMIRSLGSA